MSDRPTPEIVFFPPFAERWNYVRGLGNEEEIKAEVKGIISRYEDDDEAIAAARFGADKITLSAMVSGVVWDVDVRYDADAKYYVVLSVAER